ncbi:hypothetical protein [uncultured Desulfobacter sp.]|uniref:hypothetical protein n=1 Tax=uncultured Desulfobacter sp. TaxID=240139 RepID=UPI002AAB40A0|nr:hypothetical protein [uncultured Desulfobacter sp.]
MIKPTSSRKGYAEYHQVSDRETQAQSKPGQKCRQQTVAAQIPRIHIFSNVWTVKNPDSCQKHETVQGQSPGINQSKAGQKPVAGHPGIEPMLYGMVELLPAY